ncbi:MAG: HEAT repeat domain-containing protein [Planctomycetota bacterium]
MRVLLLGLLLPAACGTMATEPKEDARSAREPGDDEIFVERKASEFGDRRTVPKPTDDEVRDFERVWELFRQGDLRWPVERDRFKRRSDAAGYVLAGHLLRYYMRANVLRERAARDVVRAKDEIVAVGAPCVPALIDMMVLDRIRLTAGRSTQDPQKARYWIPDDITRKDCLDMLERIGSQAVPGLLATLERPELGVKGRRLATLALGGTRDPRAYEALVALLGEDPSWQVRADAATALGKLGDRRAVRPLERAMRTDPDPAVGRRAEKARKALLRRRS